MKKKWMATLLACALCLSLLTACGEKHIAGDGYEADADSHWQVCTDCGKIMNKAAHRLDDEDHCAVCDASVYDFGDDKALYLYDKQGNLVKNAEYASDGSVLAEYRFENQYDEDDLLLHTLEYTNGLMTGESEYEVLDGVSYLRRYTAYEDGNISYVNEYDNNENVIRMVAFDADGSITLQADSEYAQTEDGDWYECRRVEVYADGTRTVSEYAPDGSNISNIIYDADGNILGQSGEN